MTRRSAAPRSEYRHWQRFATRWADNDPYGHVNNAIYYQWFDSAVNGWMIASEMLDVSSGDPIALVVETRCSYFAPLAFPDPVDVGIALAALGRSSIRYRIGIFAEGSDSAAAQGEFVHVVVDRESRRPKVIPDHWRSKLESIS